MSLHKLIYVLYGIFCVCIFNCIFCLSIHLYLFSHFYNIQSTHFCLSVACWSRVLRWFIISNWKLTLISLKLSRTWRMQLFWIRRIKLAIEEEYILLMIYHIMFIGSVCTIWSFMMNSLWNSTNSYYV